ncbi:4-phosphopantetheinyl transferase [Actinoalloteichus sp. AHMU CJ021]|uniref:4'-phosphopantetheinyl transferase n=2 Tax=Actinoalloteichus cyanogriseus TaxID=2893586 RepID=A0ABT1JSJ6_ACTCY|nr:4'-phosphopantetheinyl transferase superfamily protein [Actinoalloteichus caeruleus]AUS80346.1 4-phosphopantetheinyl transferase [Actinoalloteichus sp. AHMU CJ021]MCP2334601.1 4'-phosphopantetheinyl transferase [Actinoalloteichus caeruleus DSM 43889]
MGAPEIAPLDSGECQVWWAARDAADPGLISLLDDAERTRHDRFRREEDRQRHLVARALSRIVLGAHLGLDPRDVRFRYECAHCGEEAHGKPVLTPDSGLRFSLSHSGESVVLAVCRGGEVGVDVEEVRENLDVDRLGDTVLCEEEQRTVAALPAERRQDAFFTYWTRKEAVLKAVGLGLALPMRSVLLSGPDEAPAMVDWRSERPPPEALRLYELAAPAGHLASLAVLDARPLRIRELPGDPLLAGAPEPLR